MSWPSRWPHGGEWRVAYQVLAGGDHRAVRVDDLDEVGAVVERQGVAEVPVGGEPGDGLGLFAGAGLHGAFQVDAQQEDDGGRGDGEDDGDAEAGGGGGPGADRARGQAVQEGHRAGVAEEPAEGGACPAVGGGPSGVRGRMVGSATVGRQAVAGAADRLHRGPAEGGVDLAAQRADVHLDGVGVAVEGAVPDGVEDLALGDGLMRPGGRGGPGRRTRGV